MKQPKPCITLYKHGLGFFIYLKKKPEKSVLYCFSLHYLYTIKQMKKPKPCITAVIKHSGPFENTREM